MTFDGLRLIVPDGQDPVNLRRGLENVNSITELLWQMRYGQEVYTDGWTLMVNDDGDPVRLASVVV